eukprot:1154256-Pelagomonas_calceolata.AAC.4
MEGQQKAARSSGAAQYDEISETEGRSLAHCVVNGKHSKVSAMFFWLSCWAAPGSVLRLPGDAQVAMQCHFLHRHALVTPTARSASAPSKA